MTATTGIVDVTLPRPHDKQREINHSTSKFKVVRAGRRGGKTVFACRQAIKAFWAGKQVLIASPSQKQVDSFWTYAKAWLFDAIQAGLILKNEQSRILTFSTPKMKGRIECRTARFPDDLRGGYGDFIILDEAAFLDENALDEVIYPMLWDNDGDLWLLSTPKAGTWFNKLCEDVINSRKGEYEQFHFTSLDNPHISKAAIARSRSEMTERAWEEEGLAKLLDEVKGALWRRSWIRRLNYQVSDFARIVVAIDPAVSTNPMSDETGIVVVGKLAVGGGYAVLEDASGHYTPGECATKAIDCYNRWSADRVIGEKNNGGQLVETNLKNLAPNLPVSLVWASKGKYARAEPIAGLYEPKDGNLGRVVHCGLFEELESQMCTWTLDATFSPDRMDAMVWGMTELTGATEWSTEEFRY
jgi:hypothetical protein